MYTRVVGRVARFRCVWVRKVTTAHRVFVCYPRQIYYESELVGYGANKQRYGAMVKRCVDVSSSPTTYWETKALSYFSLTIQTCR